MPELPEVETIRRDLASRVEGRRITSVTIPPDTGKPVQVIKGTDESTFREGVVGATITMADRRGKYLVFRLDGGLMLVVHLRMTGALLHRKADAPPDPFLRAILRLDAPTELLSPDVRNSGGLWLPADFELVPPGLGPEPLREGFTADIVADAVRGRKAPVKSIIF